jgi:DNA primase catalytic subunit
MTMAVKVMDSGLKEDFGFQNVAWFYSGRRGIHAWICDESARTLSDAGRSAVASYFEVSAFRFYCCNRKMTWDIYIYICIYLNLLSRLSILGQPRNGKESKCGLDVSTPSNP